MRGNRTSALKTEFTVLLFLLKDEFTDLKIQNSNSLRHFTEHCSTNTPTAPCVRPDVNREDTSVQGNTQQS